MDPLNPGDLLFTVASLVMGLIGALFTTVGGGWVIECETITLVWDRKDLARWGGRCERGNVLKKISEVITTAE